MLLIISPAPESTTSASATSDATSTWRRRLLPPVLALRPPSLSGSFTSARNALNAGATPNSRPVRQETSRANAKTRPSIGIESTGRSGRCKRVQLESIKQQPRAPGGQQQPRRAARQRQQDALGKQLARDARSRRAQRAPDGKFLLPRRAARQQQVRDVHAGNQQHERHRREQRQHGGAKALHPELAQGRHGRAHVRVFLGILPLRRCCPTASISARACATLTPGFRRAMEMKLLSPRPKSVLV